MTAINIELIIYIPTFNRFEKLRNCLHVISREIIGLENRVLVYVSNNGSTDGTKEYLDSLSYGWIYIRHNATNLGFALNVMHCFELPVKSEFVWPIGDDEYLMPGAISGILSLIRGYPLTDYIFCNTTAFPSQQADEVLKVYLEKGSIGTGTIKSSKYVGTALVDFEQLIDPDIADTLLGELMVSCFRQSSICFDVNGETYLNGHEDIWGDLDFETAGRVFQPHNLPFLHCFSGKTKAVYCDIPRTFNFWGSADWIKEYDYTFPIAIMYLICQYKERGFISDAKYMKLLDYYYLAMRNSLARQVYGKSAARPFNARIKAKMFDFLFEYSLRRWEESEKSSVASVHREEKDKGKVTSGLSTATVGTTSIIILTHNQLEHTKLCLQSIEQHTSQPHELILVDNGSTDGTVQYLEKYASNRNNVRMIANKENLGFAAGNNQGLAIANGDYLLLLNNDTVVTEGWLGSMISLFEKFPETGIVGPVSNYVSGPQQVKGTSYKTLEEMHNFAVQWAGSHAGQTMEFYRVVGFCLLARREVIDRIGGLDEQFGSGNFEDDDFCLRAAAAGYKARIAIDAFVHHAGSQTFKGAGIDYNKSLDRNWGVFKTKWKLPSDLPYGSAYNIKIDASDLPQYYIPLASGSIYDKTGQFLRAAHDEPKQRIEGLFSIIIRISDDIDGAMKCLHNIKEYTPETYEIILVLSGSSRNVLKWAKKLVHEGKIAKYIESPSDSDYAGEINKGIEGAKGEYITLLDVNAMVAPHWLGGLLECLETAPDAGIVGPMTNAMPVIGQSSPHDGASLENIIGYSGELCNNYRNRRIEQWRIPPTCMVFRHQLMEKTGLFNEKMKDIGLMNDEFCLKAVSEGYTNYIAGDVFVYYGGKQTTYDEVFVEDEKRQHIDDQSPAGKRLAILKTAVASIDLYHRGFVDNAVERLFDSIKTTPDEKELYYALARICIESGRFSDVLHVMESMPEPMKDDLKSIEYAGYIMEGLGQDDEADTYLERLFSIAPEYAPAINLNGLLTYKNGNTDTAEELFETSIRLDPGYGEPYKNLGQLRQNQGRHEEALSLLERAFILSPTVKGILDAYYSTVCSLKAFDKAGYLLADAKRLYPNHKKIALLHIDILIRQSRNEEAMQEMKEAVTAFRPDHELFSLVITAVDEKLLRGVLEEVEKKIPDNSLISEKDIDYICAHIKHAGDCLTAGNIEEGKVILQSIEPGQTAGASSATDNEKEIADNLYRQAVALQEIGRTDLSIKEFELILEITDGNPEVHNDIGVLYFQENRIDEALHHLKKARELDPDNIDYIMNMAGVYMQKEAVDEAIECYQYVIERQPDNIDASLALANLCSKAGLEDAATFYYGKVLEIEPENEDVKQYLQQKKML